MLALILQETLIPYIQDILNAPQEEQIRRIAETVCELYSYRINNKDMAQALQLGEGQCMAYAQLFKYLMNA